MCMYSYKQQTTTCYGHKQSQNTAVTAFTVWPPDNLTQLNSSFLLFPFPLPFLCPSIRSCPITPPTCQSFAEQVRQRKSSKHLGTVLCSFTKCLTPGIVLLAVSDPADSSCPVWHGPFPEPAVLQVTMHSHCFISVTATGNARPDYQPEKKHSAFC